PTSEPTPTSTLIATTTEIASVQAFATKGDELLVKGTVKDDRGQGVDGIPVEIFLNETKEHGGFLLGSSEAALGVFEISVRIPTDIPVGEYQVLAHALPFRNYLESWSDPPIVIRSETAIELEGDDRVDVGGVGYYTGVLSERFGGPLGGQAIELLVDGEVVASTVTDRDGTFSFEHQFIEVGQAKVAVRFQETDVYLGSQAVVGIDILTPAANRLWVWLAASVVPVTLLGLGSAFYLYRRRQGPQLGPDSTPPTAPTAPPEKGGVAPPSRRGRRGTLLYIELPKIQPTLPLVWGLGEPLDIRITLQDENQAPLAYHTLEVSISGEHLEVETDEHGACVVQHTFEDKGSFTVGARFHGDSDLRAASQDISLRVVEYRE
ncbi:MAG: hypothetical protein HYX93_04360, partial [Chloroflexi bacterium]|nr:hypothetical protein [Chloroflexota bacterium]